MLKVQKKDVFGECKRKKKPRKETYFSCRQHQVRVHEEQLVVSVTFAEEAYVRLGTLSICVVGVRSGGKIKRNNACTV